MTKGTIWRGKQVSRALATQLTGSSDRFHVGRNDKVKKKASWFLLVQKHEETELSLLHLWQPQARPRSVPLWRLTMPCRTGPHWQPRVSFACPAEQKWECAQMGGVGEHLEQKDAEALFKWPDGSYFLCFFLSTGIYIEFRNSQHSSLQLHLRHALSQDSHHIALPCFWWVPGCLLGLHSACSLTSGVLGKVCFAPRWRSLNHFL